MTLLAAIMFFFFFLLWLLSGVPTTDHPEQMDSHHLDPDGGDYILQDADSPSDFLSICF